MSNSTSVGLPTISEMITFINNQELTLKIEDHVSMTGKTHHNLVVYFKENYVNPINKEVQPGVTCEINKGQLETLSRFNVDVV